MSNGVGADPNSWEGVEPKLKAVGGSEEAVIIFSASANESREGTPILRRAGGVLLEDISARSEEKLSMLDAGVKGGSTLVVDGLTVESDFGDDGRIVESELGDEGSIGESEMRGEVWVGVRVKWETVLTVD